MTRRLTCRTCGDPVHVDWIGPKGEDLTDQIDPSRYQCGECMKPVQGHRVLALTDRAETTTYNPDQADIAI